MEAYGGRTTKLEKSSRVTRTKRAGLNISVGRVGRLLREGRYAKRIAGGAPVYLAAVLEYVCAELLDLASEACRDHKKTRITPRHIQFGICNDDSFSNLLSKVAISSGGFVPIPFEH